MDIANEQKLAYSTITNNMADANADGIGHGGGVFSRYSYNLKHSIIAGNYDKSNHAPDVSGIVSSSYSLLSFGAEFLGPLADNGGLMLPDDSHILTHALLPGSPAIDTGEWVLVSDTNSFPEFDGRGAPYARIVNGALDIGAYESQPPQGTFDGDFDGDGDVDGRDFLTWQRGVVTTPANKADGDATGNELVDGNDLAVWQETYGRELSALGFQLLANSPESSSVYRVPGSGSRLLTLGTSLLHDTAENDTADNAESKFADLVIEDFNRDQAFEYWQPQQRCDFGDIATRRAAGSSVSERTLILQR